MAIAGQKVHINWDEFEMYAKSGAPPKDIAQSFWISVNTLHRRIREHYKKDFGEVVSSFNAKGLNLLRAKQFKKAMDGNSNLLIFLGKERLGQGKNEVMAVPNQDTLTIQHENILLKASNEDLKDKLDAVISQIEIKEENVDKPEAE